MKLAYLGNMSDDFFLLFIFQLFYPLFNIIVFNESWYSVFMKLACS